MQALAVITPQNPIVRAEFKHQHYGLFDVGVGLKLLSCAPCEA